ncbi:MAG: tRNA (adenosine(37)-N6)-threonylcarbamoyltransferase complex ATPase subunit type 1 TsaE [Pseudomonadota bacterium]
MPTRTTEILLNSPEETDGLGQALAAFAKPGLCVLLSGEIGAGKSHLARATIRKLLSEVGLYDDIPSPTFTLVQTYQAGSLDIWHADLYRLGSADELVELGLDEAFDTAFCLVEWPDRLGDIAPQDALSIHLQASEIADQHICQISATDIALVAKLAQFSPESTHV